MTATLESAFLAQLEDEDDLATMPPARFATLATRAVLLTESAIDWKAEVVRARLLPSKFLPVLRKKLAGGVHNPIAVTACLTEREAELTCRWGGLFLTESVRQHGSPPGFYADLADKLTIGEIDPVHALAELSSFEVEIACSNGRMFLAELKRRMNEHRVPIPGTQER